MLVQPLKLAVVYFLRLCLVLLRSFYNMVYIDAAEPKNLKQVLKEFITTSVTLSDEGLYKAILKREIEVKLISAMKKCDTLFAVMYQNIYYTGSFYDGLRIKEADEFDLNIRLRMPFKGCEVVYTNVPRGYVKYKPVQLEAKYKNIKDLMDKTGTYLSQQNVHRWMQSVVDTAIKNSPKDFANFKRSYNGPAITLAVTDIKSGKVLDVDLVAAVQLPQLPGSIRPNCIPMDVPDKDRFAFIVPKPVPPQSDDGTGTLWRVSIPGVERHLIHHKGFLKPLIKIFKAIRDHYEWSFIASYYIKTMFMLQVEKHPEASFWQESDMDKRFEMMLNEFIAIMREPRLDHYFFSGVNLLATVKPVTSENVKGCLERMLKCVKNEDWKKLVLLLNGRVTKLNPRRPQRTEAMLEAYEDDRCRTESVNGFIGPPKQSWLRCSIM